MSDVYSFSYEARIDGATRGIDRLIAKIQQLDAVVDKSQAKLKNLGQSMPGVAHAASALGNLGNALGTVDTLSAKSTTSLAGVGKNTGAMTAAATKAEKIVDWLKQIEAQGPKAAAALGGVGGGMGGAGGGQGGRAGGGGASVAKRIASQVGGNIIDRIGRATIGAYAHSQEDEREFQTEMAEKAIEFRNERRELAGLMEHEAPNAAVIKSSTELMKASGMSGREEAAFSTDYYGSAAIGRDKGNLGAAGAARDNLEADIRRVGGQFGVRAGLDAKTAGDLTGIVSAYKKIDTVKDLAGQLSGFHYGLDQGRFQMTPLVRGALTQAGAAIDGGNMGDIVKTGRVADLPELGAFVGVMSATAGGGKPSGTNYGQLTRLLNQVSGPDAEWLKSAGIDKEKGDLNKLKALDAHFKANGVTDIRGYLGDKGFGNEQDLRAVKHAVENLPVLQKRIDEAHRRAANPDEFLKKNADFQASDIGRDRRASAGLEAEEVESGTQTEALITLRREGRAHRMGSQSYSGIKAGTAKGGLMSRAFGLLGAGDGENELDEMEGIAMLGQRYKAMGKSLEKEHPELVKQQGLPSLFDPFGGKGRTSQTNEVRAQEVAKATQEIEAIEQAARNAAPALNQIAVALNRIGQQAGPGGMGGNQGPGLPPPPQPFGKGGVVPRRP